MSSASKNLYGIASAQLASAVLMQETFEGIITTERPSTLIAQIGLVSNFYTAYSLPRAKASSASVLDECNASLRILRHCLAPSPLILITAIIASSM